MNLLRAVPSMSSPSPFNTLSFHTTLSKASYTDFIPWSPIAHLQLQACLQLHRPTTTMAPKPSFPASLLRAYTSLISRRTSQLQFHASRLLGVELQSQSQYAWRRHFDGVLGGRLQAIPIPVRSQGFGQRRWHSTDFQKSKAYEFDDVHKSPVLHIAT